MTTTMATTQTPAVAPAQPTTTMRAYRFALDPTPRQQQSLARHAGAARWDDPASCPARAGEGRPPLRRRPSGVRPRRAGVIIEMRHPREGK